MQAADGAALEPQRHHGGAVRRLPLIAHPVDRPHQVQEDRGRVVDVVEEALHRHQVAPALRRRQRLRVAHGDRGDAAEFRAVDDRFQLLDGREEHLLQPGHDEAAVPLARRLQVAHLGQAGGGRLLHPDMGAGGQHVLGQIGRLHPAVRVVAGDDEHHLRLLRRQHLAMVGVAAAGPEQPGVIRRPAAIDVADRRQIDRGIAQRRVDVAVGMAAGADEAGLEAPLVFEVVGDARSCGHPLRAPWVRPSVKRRWVAM